MTVEVVELVTVPLELARPLHTARWVATRRDALLVHVRAEEAEGWAEVAVEATPSYAPEFTSESHLVLAEHLVPLAWTGPTGDAAALGPHLAAARGHHPARAALELAVLDAQLRAAGVSLAAWLGSTADDVPAGATLGLAADPDAPDDLLAEADLAVSAGAARLRVKIAPGAGAGPLLALRAHLGPAVALQADANGSFRLDDPAHAKELAALDEVGLACLEQPLAPEDLVGSARLAERLVTPICLDEPLTSVGALEAAVALGACTVACLKPGRVGGWIAARRFADRAAELGVTVWVGGMLETNVGRAANAALAGALLGGPATTLTPDLDPRPRYAADLVEPLAVASRGRFAVPAGPGTGATPPPSVLVGGGVDVTISRRPR